MSTQAKPSRLYKPEDGTSCRRYILTIDHEIRAVLEERFFDILMSNLLPGDEITVKQFDIVNDNMANSVLLARQDFEVVSLDHANRRVNTVPRSDVVTFEDKALEPLTVKWNVANKVHQVLNGEEVVFESADKAEATAHAEAA